MSTFDIAGITREKILDKRLWGIILFTVIVKALVIWIASFYTSSAWFGHTVADIWTWVEFWQGAKQGGIPYVDYTKEYAVGAGLLYWIMSPFIDITEGRWKILLLGHAVFIACADVVNAGLMYLILQEIAPKRSVFLTVLFVLTPTALILTPVRFESYIITTVLIGYWFHRHDKPIWATFFWSLGCWIKWFPSFFIAAQEVRALLIEKKKYQWLKSLAVFLGVALAMNLPILILTLLKNGNWDKWWLPYAFHASRGLSWDTMLGVGTLWFGDLPFEKFSAQWTVALMILALIIKPGLSIEYKGTLICIAAVFLNRIYSTQFNLWFYPFLFIVLSQETKNRWWWLFGTFVVLDAVNIFIYPFSFANALEEMKNFAPLAARQSGGIWTVLFSGAIVLRTILLALLSALLLKGQPASSQRSVTFGRQLDLFDSQSG